MKYLILLLTLLGSLNAQNKRQVDLWLQNTQIIESKMNSSKDKLTLKLTADFWVKQSIVPKEITKYEIASNGNFIFKKQTVLITLTPKPSSQPKYKKFYDRMFKSKSSRIKLGKQEKDIIIDFAKISFKENRILSVTGNGFSTVPKIKQP